jgi:hypothetical protein
MCVLCINFNRCHGKAVKAIFGVMLYTTDRKAGHTKRKLVA